MSSRSDEVPAHRHGPLPGDPASSSPADAERPAGSAEAARVGAPSAAGAAGGTIVPSEPGVGIAEGKIDSLLRVLPTIPMLPSVRRLAVAQSLMWVYVLSLLVASGMALGRVVAVAAFFLTTVTVQVSVVLLNRGRTPTARRVFVFVCIIGAVLSFSLSITGGITSPLLPWPAAMVAFVTVMLGPGKLLVAYLAIFAVELASATILPPAWWRGPPVPAPYHGLILLGVTSFVTLALSVVGANVARALGTMAASVGELKEKLLIEALSRAQSLESIGSRVAHELKNPLASIKGMTQLLARGEADGERAKRRLGVVLAEVSRMEVILEDYLTFARPLEDLRPESVDLGALAAEVVGILDGRAEQAGVRLAARGEGVRAWVDPRRIKEALLNLAANAVEATPRGGSVTLQVSVVRGASGDAAEVAVVDTGRGMSDDVLAKVGRPFFTTRAQGTGLGVVIARAIAGQHGGTLEITSREGQGTTATLRVPLREASSKEAKGAE